MKKSFALTIVSLSLLTLASCNAQINTDPNADSYYESDEEPSAAVSSVAASSAAGSYTTYTIDEFVYFVVVADYSADKVQYLSAVPLNGEDYPAITDMSQFDSYLEKSNRSVRVGDSLGIKGTVTYQDGQYKNGSVNFGTYVKVDATYSASSGKFVYSGDLNPDFWSQLADFEGMPNVIADDGSYKAFNTLEDNASISVCVPKQWILKYTKGETINFESRFIGIYAA